MGVFRKDIFSRVAKIRAEKLKHHQTMQFPKNFFWGTSTSAHQVEGDNYYNDWWAWEHGKKNRRRSLKACDHYERFEEDFGLLKKMHQNAHRISVEWSRFEPEEDVWNPEAVKHYRRVLESLKEKGITPFVTIHHFTNPQWFMEKGGWENRKSPEYFSHFVERLVKELGDLTTFWITINEPLVYSTMSYLFGIWPPQKKNYISTYRVYRNLARAHKRAYSIIHKTHEKYRWKKPNVGISVNSVSFYSYKKHEFFSWLFLRVADWLWNHSFFALTGKTHDFIGINYYFHYRFKLNHFRTLQFFVEARHEHREMSSVGWEVYPQGIFDVLMDLKRHNLPMYVTENGIASRNESKRTRYLVSYVKEVYHAIQAGADVRGYFYWSFLDNFEWEKGFRPRFGLLDVNYKTQKRSFRHAARIYSEIASANSLLHKHLRYLGHSVSP